MNSRQSSPVRQSSPPSPEVKPGNYVKLNKQTILQSKSHQTIQVSMQRIILQLLENNFFLLSTQILHPSEPKALIKALTNRDFHLYSMNLTDLVQIIEINFKNKFKLQKTSGKDSKNEIYFFIENVWILFVQCNQNSIDITLQQIVNILSDFYESYYKDSELIL
mmetsp:Transcript_13205/g.13033  ORF Transcript_13205/g.13033 Transcript_13205/m.13033 type:complete len:164 (+) Transcript_13205:713-1204(+)